jgi:SAM-dependent methyltransferase
MTFVNTEQADFWSSMASTWAEIENRLETTAGVAGRLAMDALDLQPGEHVVDLGCGTGPTTVEMASRVGPDGSVVGVDIAAEMVERARQRAAEVGTGNVNFVHADVQSCELGAGSFDAAYSRFGVMFYSDPVAAFANVRASLRTRRAAPAGARTGARAGARVGARTEARLAFVCWQNVFANEWMLVPGMAAMEATGTPPSMPGPDEPGPFSLADPDRVRSVLEDAGFSGVEVAPHNDFQTINESEIHDAAAVSLRVGPAREALRDADDATRRRALDAVREAMAARVEGGELRLSRGYLIVTAR